MSNILSRVDSLSEKVANLKQIMRANKEKSKTKKTDKKSDAAVASALKQAIAPNSKAKSNKRKDSNDGGTVLRKPIDITIEKKSDGKQIEKAIEKISVKFDAQQDRNNRQSSRDPSKIKIESAQNHKKPLALSLQK